MYVLHVRVLVRLVDAVYVRLVRMVHPVRLLDVVLVHVHGVRMVAVVTLVHMMLLVLPVDDAFPVGRVLVLALHAAVRLGILLCVLLRI